MHGVYRQTAKVVSTKRQSNRSDLQCQESNLVTDGFQIVEDFISGDLVGRISRFLDDIEPDLVERDWYDVTWPTDKRDDTLGKKADELWREVWHANANPSSNTERLEKLIGHKIKLGREFAQVSINRKGVVLDRHVDGVGKTDYCENQASIYDVLVGIAISGTDKPDHGNLMYWPESHQSSAIFFRNSPNADVVEVIHRGLPSPGMSPKQFVAQPGDAIICHRLMHHAVAPNHSEQERAMIYFRINQSKFKETNPKLKKLVVDGELDETAAVGGDT